MARLIDLRQVLAERPRILSRPLFVLGILVPANLAIAAVLLSRTALDHKAGGYLPTIFLVLLTSASSLTLWVTGLLTLGDVQTRHFQDEELELMVTHSIARRRQRDDILKLATETFEDDAFAESWLEDPNLALDGRSPKSLLKTQKGRTAVKELLVRIQHGVLA